VTNPVVTRDPYRYQAKAWRTAKQWAKWENVGLAPTLDLQDLILNWTDRRVIDLNARGAVTSIELERTIEGASTLTIVLRDPNARLFNEWAKRMRPRVVKVTRTPVEVDEGWEPMLPPDLIGRAMEVHLDGAIFRLVKAGYQHQTEELTLTFEDRIVYLLRRKHGERRASRAKVTRAQFVLSLLREIALTKPPFICPDLSVRQAIDKKDTGSSSQRSMPRASTRALRKTDAPLTSPSTPGESSGSGIASGANLTVKGAAATPEQKRVGQQVLDTCSQAGADPRPTKACVCACIVESTMQNLKGHHDLDSQGVLQVRDSTAKPMGIDNLNVPECVTAFLKRGFWGKGGAIQIAQKNPGMSVGMVAQNTQGSAYPGRYDEVASEAQKWIDSYTGGAFGDAAADTGGSYAKSYQFAREADENSWDAIQRLADEVAWRFFVVGEAVYYMSEEALFRRRPRYEITADSEFLIDLAYDVDWGRPLSEATLTVALDRWGAPPGAVMLLDGFGPPDGRWLITSVRRDWFSPTAEITVKQPGKQKLEPTSERGQRATAATGAGGTTSAEGGRITTVGGAKGIVEQAAQIAAQAGGQGVTVVSSYRPGSTTTTGNQSDHAANTSAQAARDIAVQGIDALVGPPSPKLDDGVVAVGKAFGKNYGNGKRTIVDTFPWRGFRIQIIWRTPAYGGHMGHIHVGARKGG